MDYIPRIADAALGEKLAYAKAVCIRGPRTSGRGSLRSAQGRALPALREGSSWTRRSLQPLSRRTKGLC